MKLHAIGLAALTAVSCIADTSAADLKVPRRKPLTANVGVVSVGLDTYWRSTVLNMRYLGLLPHLRF